jgi:hypothetical protein
MALTLPWVAACIAFRTSLHMETGITRTSLIRHIRCGMTIGASGRSCTKRLRMPPKRIFNNSFSASGTKCDMKILYRAWVYCGLAACAVFSTIIVLSVEKIDVSGPISTVFCWPAATILLRCGISDTDYWWPIYLFVGNSLNFCFGAILGGLFGGPIGRKVAGRTRLPKKGGE